MQNCRQNSVKLGPKLVELDLSHGSINYEGLVQGIQTFLTYGIGQLSLLYTRNCHLLCIAEFNQTKFRVIVKISSHVTLRV